jgi:phosphatidylcholine synthase
MTTLAWLVHAYTALGLVCAAGMAVLIMQGSDAAFRGAFLLMMIATAIDATDGWFARRVRVKELLPGFDGTALDNTIDFQTYVTLPLLLLWRAGVLPGAQAWLLVLPLLASAYGFSQVEAKTADGYFLGFPSYWNIIAFYLYMLSASPAIAAAVIVVFSVLTFVPSRYLYATRGGPFAAIINVGAPIWFLALAAALLDRTPRGHLIAQLSFVYPATYLALSAVIEQRERQRAGVPTANPRQ